MTFLRMMTCAGVCAVVVAVTVAVARADEPTAARLGQVRNEQPRPSGGARLAAPVLLSVEIVPDGPAPARGAAVPPRCDDRASERCDVAPPPTTRAVEP